MASAAKTAPQVKGNPHQSQPRPARGDSLLVRSSLKPELPSVQLIPHRFLYIVPEE